MLTVRKSDSLFDTLIGKQPIQDDAKYRRLTFCVLRVVDGDYVAFNGLTKELVKLTENEYQVLSSDNVCPNDETLELIERWFLVPLEHDDISLSEEFRSFVHMLVPNKGYSNYTIMTTTDCNARCFYCYEMGRSRIPMSEQTAKDVAAFILKSSPKGKKIRISWYGGEPLYNQSVIDTVSDTLKAEGVEFESLILTNGYLLDKDTLEKAITRWNTTSVQIAMDGTEDIYNRSKAYIYNDGRSPFHVVMDNVEAALARGIKMIIRLNMDRHNQNDLKKLADIYVERFGAYKNLYVYPAIIFELEGAQRPNHTPEDRMDLAKRYMDFWDYCVSKGLLKEDPLGKAVRHSNCIADSEGSVMVTPDGHLGKCDHYSENNFVGDIYSGITNTEMVASQQERANSHELCEGCAFFPNCIKLKKCPGEGFYLCDEAKRYIANEKLCRSVDATYRRESKNIVSE